MRWLQSLVMLPLVLLLAWPAKGQVSAVFSPDGKPLSQRVVTYWIDAALNTNARTLDAKESIEYRNLSDRPLSTIPFHLYLNAFRPQSTYSWEKHRDNLPAPTRPAEQGAIDIRSISAEGYGDLAGRTKFIAPDDGNLEDHTVMEVSLPKPLAPGETIRFQLAFHDKLPRSGDRTGYTRDFFMGAQWFPKVGVLWHGQWNCHQYHADTEFFADFGSYNVKLTLPQKFIVGASGIQTGEQKNSDGTRTLSFRGEDIHDFAWAASPNFQAADDTFTNSLGTVKLHALILASHADQRERYLSSLKQSMRKYDEWYGPYPYKQITVVDPEPGSQAGGMEFPTLITGDAQWWSPPWSLTEPEITVIHEFGHQYWYGMVATNEFEEPWLDEGINSYAEGKVAASLYGENASILNARTMYASDAAYQRFFYFMSPAHDPIVREGWKFLNGESYGSIVYGKSATALYTLEAMVGETTFRKVMRTYFMRYRFQHPTGADFFSTVLEVTGRTDLGPFLNQAFAGTERLDYAVDSIHSYPSRWWKDGYKPPFRSEIVISRKGSFISPVNVEVGFADGSKEHTRWDGQDSWTRLSFDKPAAAVVATVTAEGNSGLDLNSFNNSYRTQHDRTARRKLTNYWVVAQQLLTQWLAFLL
jgi:Peptidase family M1 domain